MKHLSTLLTLALLILILLAGYFTFDGRWGFERAQESGQAPGSGGAPAVLEPSQ